MRKKIPVKRAIVGMYVHQLCGNWVDSPFWKPSFKLSSTKELKSLQSSNIRDIWIDTNKGKDIDEPEKVNIDASLLVKVSQPDSCTEHSACFEEELENARRIQTKAATVVTSMFNEVRMGNALQTENAIPLANEIYLSVVRNPSALISLTRLKTKDDYTYMHSVAVCALMIALGRKMGVDEDTVKSLGMAGLLHDVGKMVIPDLILNKPGKLTDEEFGLIKSHPERGWEMLKESEDVDDIARDVCLHHHERVDGTGYPEKLTGDNLSLFAKMGAVCDVYDAITSNRSYKDGWSPAESIRKMASWKNGHFDEKVFNAFVSTVGIYPAGTLIKLSSGRLGVVTDQSNQGLLKPIVKVFYSTTTMSNIPPKILNLAKSSETITSLEDPATWNIDLKPINGF